MIGHFDRRADDSTGKLWMHAYNNLLDIQFPNVFFQQSTRHLELLVDHHLGT
jgi:hypothetical protein